MSKNIGILLVWNTTREKPKEWLKNKIKKDYQSFDDFLDVHINEIKEVHGYTYNK